MSVTISTPYAFQLKKLYNRSTFIWNKFTFSFNRSPSLESEITLGDIAQRVDAKSAWACIDLYEKPSYHVEIVKTLIPSVKRTIESSVLLHDHQPTKNCITIFEAFTNGTVISWELLNSIIAAYQDDNNPDKDVIALLAKYIKGSSNKRLPFMIESRIMVDFIDVDDDEFENEAKQQIEDICKVFPPLL